jgi:uncharacterized protein RhaS with RHS repeats
VESRFKGLALNHGNKATKLAPDHPVWSPFGAYSEVTDQDGFVIEKHTCDSEGRGLTSELDDGRERYTIDYTFSPTVTVTDAPGNITSYTMTGIGQIPRITKITGPCSSCGGGAGRAQERLWGYDASGRITSASRTHSN